MAREHIRAFADMDQVRIAGIYSRTRSRAETLAAEYSLPVVYNSVSELYQRTRADLVVVTVSEVEMSPVSQACFDFPWTVLLEKPPGLNVAEAEEICGTAEARNRMVLVALNRRFLSSTRAVLADLAVCEETRFIKVQDQENQTQAIALGHSPVAVENWMYANSIHVIDYFQLFGRGKVMAAEPVLPWDPENPGVVVCKIEFASGDIGLYEGIWHGPGPWAVNVVTAKKRWEMRPLEHAAFQLAGQRHLESVPTHRWDQEFKPGFRLQAEMAVAAASGQPSDCPTLEDSLETMRLIEAIFSR